MNSLTLRKAIRDKYTFPGMYPMFAVTSDGAALCMDCCRKEYKRIADSNRHNSNDGWQVAAVDINWEDNELTCDNCGNSIESAYGEN